MRVPIIEFAVGHVSYKLAIFLLNFHVLHAPQMLTFDKGCEVNKRDVISVSHEGRTVIPQ